MDRVSLPLLLLLLLVACEVEGRARGRGRRVAGEQRLVPAWPGPYWEISGQFCSATSPRLHCCLDRNDRWVGSHGHWSVSDHHRMFRCSVLILDTLCYCDQFCNR